jgi:hypothetical protein
MAVQPELMPSHSPLPISFLESLAACERSDKGRIELALRNMQESDDHGGQAPSDGARIEGMIAIATLQPF